MQRNILERSLDILEAKVNIPYKVKCKLDCKIIDGTIAGRQLDYPKVYTSFGSYEISWQLAVRAYKGAVISL